MSGKLNRHAYEYLIVGDIEWLLKQPRTLEREHIEAVLRCSADREYGAQRAEEGRSGIYVASRVVRAPMWLEYRKRGVKINASWIDEAGEGETADFGELWARIRAEIARSRALVFYAHGVEDFPFKGALVEVGMALAMGKPVFACINGVMLDGRTLRPLGSWALDRNVTMCDTLDEAVERGAGPAEKDK